VLWQVLDAVEAAGVRPEERPVVTHCQILGADLVARMRALGAVANVQPSFVPTDMHWVAKRGLRPEALRYAYAWKTLMDAGVCVAGGSDAPIESCAPLEGLYDAIHRRARTTPTPTTTPSAPSSSSSSSEPVPPPAPEVFRPEECLSFAQAVHIYTAGAAAAAGCESFLGRLAVGYLGDMVVLDSPVDRDPSLLATAQLTHVIVGGRVVHERRTGEGAAPAGAGLHGDAYFPGKGGRPTSMPTPMAMPLSMPPPLPRLRGDGGGHGTRNGDDDDAMWTEMCACRLLGRYCATSYR